MNKMSNLLILLVAMSLSLSGCGDKKTGASANSAIALKVNGQAIHAIEFEMKGGNQAGGGQHSVNGPMLKQTIDMELLRQAAVAAKLDSDERVLAQLALANRMVLSSAFMQKQLDGIAKPSEAEAAAFFNQNPERFAQRKQYQFQEFSLQPPAGRATEIQALAAKVKSPDELEQGLTANRIPHSSTPVTTTGDQLPDAVLQKLKGVPVGGHITLGDDKQMNVVFLLSEQPQPMLLAQASATIVNQLWDKRKRETLDKTMKQLHDKAKIEYVAPYSENGFTAPATPH